VKELRIRVKNVGDDTLSCLAISFGLLKEMDTKLKPHESWPWGLTFGRGDCHRSGSKVNRDLELRSGHEIVLAHSDIRSAYVSYMGRMGQFAKAVLRLDAQVKLQNHRTLESRLLLPANTRFPDDEPY